MACGVLAVSARTCAQSQRPPKLLTTHSTCCALRTPPEQLVSAPPISTETRTFVVAAEKALSPYKWPDVHMETAASLRPNPGGSASPVTQMKAGGASRAPGSSHHAHEPRESASYQPHAACSGGHLPLPIDYRRQRTRSGTPSPSARCCHLLTAKLRTRHEAKCVRSRRVSSLLLLLASLALVRSPPMRTPT